MTDFFKLLQHSSQPETKNEEYTGSTGPASRRSKTPAMPATDSLPSPLDPFLAAFLKEIEARGGGYQPGPDTTAIAERLDMPRAFVEGLLTSARTRGLVKPMYGRGNKVRWNVSPSGARLMQARSAAHQTASSTEA
jgi:hypothetical protein